MGAADGQRGVGLGAGGAGGFCWEGGGQCPPQHCRLVTEGWAGRDRTSLAAGCLQGYHGGGSTLCPRCPAQRVPEPFGGRRDSPRLIRAAGEVCLRAPHACGASSPLLAAAREMRAAGRARSSSRCWGLLIPEPLQAAWCGQRYGQRHSRVLQGVLGALVLLGLQAKGQKSVKCREWRCLLVNWLSREKGLGFAWRGLRAQRPIGAVQSSSEQSCLACSPLTPAGSQLRLRRPRVAERVAPRFGPAEQQGTGMGVCVGCVCGEGSAMARDCSPAESSARPALHGDPGDSRRSPGCHSRPWN